MHINESILRKIVRETLIKEAESWLTTDKNVTAGDNLSFGRSRFSFQVLTSSKKDRATKEFYALALWPDTFTPRKKFENVPKRAWDRHRIHLFHSGDTPNIKKIANAKWLVKNYYYPKYGFEWKDNDHKSNFDALDKSKKLRKYIMGPQYSKPGINLYRKSSKARIEVNSNKKIMEMAKKSPLLNKFANDLKKAYKQGRIAAISTKWLQSNKQFKKKTGGDAFNEFVTDTTLESISAISDLGAKWIPALEGVSMAAGFSSALVKMGRSDILGSAIALITTIPVVGDSIGLLAKNLKSLGSSASTIARESAEHLWKFIGKVLDGELTNAFEKSVKAFCDFASGEGYKYEKFFPKIENALILFRTTLHKIIKGKEWNAERELAGLKQKANAGS